MEEAAANPKVIEDAMVKALSAFFPSLGTTGNQAVEFYNKFHQAADDYDRDFVKRYDEDLDTTLIFAGLFSAVTSAFIVDVQSKLEPDFEEMNHTLLKIVASAALGNVPTGADAALPEWKGPDGTIVHIQAILYSSLLTSLLAAFIAMLGKQWLNRYASVDRGSVIDRGRQRKHKMDGMTTWQFDFVMECLPLMLQAALLLLGYALSNYLFSINKTITSVAIGFTAFGTLFYLLIVSAATLSYNCPFQTPLSLILRLLIRFDNEHKGYLRRAREWFGRFSPFKNKDGSTEALMGSVLQQPPQLFNTETTGVWDGYVVDSSCIAWMFEMPMEMDFAMAIARFIPEITWHAGIRSIPLVGLHETLLKCFDRSSGHSILKPAFRDHAYFTAKALIHIAIQRMCIGGESDRAMFRSISKRHLIMGHQHYEGDSDLEATLGIVDRIFGDSEPTSWHDFSFTIPHQTWMGHILLYRAWDVLWKGEPLPDYVREFVLHSLRLDPPPPAMIVADCIFIVGLVLGIKLHISDLMVIDKSIGRNPQINRIYEKLTEMFGNPSPTAEDIDCALESMELVAPLSENDVAQKSYNLFHVVMQAPVSPAYSQEKKWQASRLTMHGAYKWDQFLPWVEDPHDIITFLDYHFDLATRQCQNKLESIQDKNMPIQNQDEPIQDQDMPIRSQDHLIQDQDEKIQDQGESIQNPDEKIQNHDESIQNGLRALAYASGPVTIEALKRLDFSTEPTFIQGICYAFQPDKQFQLRKAALFFLPLIGDRWFDTAHPIMEVDQMGSLCVDWASAVDGIEHTYDVQKAALTVLLGMINSPHWRPHIVPGKWKLLEYFTSVPDDSQPLRRCIDNPELLGAIKNVENPVAMTLWLQILWFKYKELIPQVQEQLEAVTKEVSQGERRTDIDKYLSAMDSELVKAEEALMVYDMWSADPVAIGLKTKINNFQQAKVALAVFKGDSL